jgi:hypothetical protein
MLEHVEQDDVGGAVESAAAAVRVGSEALGEAALQRGERLDERVLEIRSPLGEEIAKEAGAGSDVDHGGGRAWQRRVDQLPPRSIPEKLTGALDLTIEMILKWRFRIGHAIG